MGWTVCVCVCVCSFTCPRRRRDLLYGDGVNLNVLVLYGSCDSQEFGLDETQRYNQS